MIAAHDRWKVMLALGVVGAAGMLFLAARTYHDAPPVADFVDASGAVIVGRDAILDGQEVFLRRALMNHGSFFGDGGARGPDYTAEALREVGEAMAAHHEQALRTGEAPHLSAADRQALALDRTRKELRHNGHERATPTAPAGSEGRIVLSAAQVAAWPALQAFERRRFGEGPTAHALGAIRLEPAEVEALTAFFFWGAWVCAAARPGSDASYTHNWPYDPLLGNTPTPGTLLWSVIGSLALLSGLALLLYLYGRASAARPPPEHGVEPFATAAVLAATPVHPLQRAVWPFFGIAMAAFVVQVFAGALTVHDFLGFTVFFGVDVRDVLPLPVTRSAHVQLAVLWIATCWIGGSLFLLPRIAPRQPRHQLALTRLLLAMLVGVAAGTLFGVVAGPLGKLGEHWRWWGSQGWEFVELGRAFQVLLFAALLLWVVILGRGVAPALRERSPFALPNWLFYAALTISLLFASGFVAGPRTNFVIADFWRWCVIHMWAECFFEVFTTVILAYFLVKTGLIAAQVASTVVFSAAVLFLGSGLLGISHNFYWNAKPESMLAIGSVFSTLQVLPLLLLALEASRFRLLPARIGRDHGGAAAFAMGEPFLFLLAVNFWNVLGAGVFGFIINLPIVNYYEHGTYLTVNHGHAALMGVYGNLSIAAALFCGRWLLPPERWRPLRLRAAFWSLNIGLLLMVALDTLPVGVLQLQAVLDGGLVEARSDAFIASEAFQTLTWLRAVGGVLFVCGGVLPLAAFVIGTARACRPATIDDDGHAAAPPSAFAPIAVGALVVVLGVCGPIGCAGPTAAVRGPQPAATGAPGSAAPQVGAMAPDGYVAAQVRPGKVTVIDWWARWCSTCKALAPKLTALAAARPEVALVALDVTDWEPEVSARYLDGTQALPVLDVYGCDGRLFRRLEGAAASGFAAVVDEAVRGCPGRGE